MGLTQPEPISPGSPQGGGGVGEPAHAQLSAHQPTEHNRSGPTRRRRPDRAVYVPRARRSTDNGPTQNNHSEPRKCTNTPTIDPTERIDKSQPTTPRKSLDRSYCNIYRPPHLRRSRVNEHLNGDLVSEHAQVPIVTTISDLTDVKNEANVFKCNSKWLPSEYEHNYVNESVSNDVCELNMSVPDRNESLAIMDSDITPTYSRNKDEDPEQTELRRASQEINRSNRRIIKQSFDSDVLVISDPVEPSTRLIHDVIEPSRKIEDIPIEETKVNEIVKPKLEAKVSLKREENDWDAVFDDDGECLDPTLLEELTATVGKVQISKPKNNYDAYLDKTYTSLSGEEFGHVVEVYGFPSEFKTNDLLSMFAEYKDTGFEIKWVDDTHALIVFSSAKIAAEVMSNPHPMVRCRPLKDATPESRNKAKRCAEFLQPYRQRPETCTALARRLVSGALGMRLTTAREERAEERRLIDIAREKKRAAARHREAAWDGSLADNT